MRDIAPKRVAGIRPHVLASGDYDADDKIVLARFDQPLPNGVRLA